MSNHNPMVTGISPIEGVPGTKVTIRGENFGSRPEDLVGLIICGVDCTMSAEWKSSNKIIARCGARDTDGKGDIIVVTIHGRGESTVQFRCYKEPVGPLKESAVWVDDTRFFNMAHGRKRTLSPDEEFQDDPLGLSVEGNEKKELDQDLDVLFPGKCGNFSSPNFSAEWFLLESHSSTSFEDLCAGLIHLKRKVESQREGQISFLKANVGSVLEQLNTLSELKCKFESDILEYGRQSTSVLEKAISDCKIEADKLFEDVLQRKDRADGTRNAINVLKRFHFLFYLPVNTERNIQKGDYEIVINDYARAKSLFGNTQIPLFRKFYNEVEKRIDNLRQILSEQLVKMPSSLEHQKKIIRNLHHLEAEGDPAWECILAQHDYIMSLLFESRDSHLNRELADHDLGSKGQGTTSNTPSVHAASSRNTTPAAKYNKIMMSSIGEWQASAPVRVILAEDLSECLSANFPDLWKLSQAYFGGELLPPELVQIDQSKCCDCKEMTHELLYAYCSILRGALTPHTLDPESPSYRKFHVWPDTPQEVLTPWLPQVLRHVRECYTTLLSLDLPNDALETVAEFLFDLRIHCLISLFQQTEDHIRNLHIQEQWKLEVDDEEGGYTQLPQICEGVIIECAQLVCETVLDAGRREHSILQNPIHLKKIETLVQNVTVAFAQALSKLAFSDPDEDPPEVDQLQGESSGHRAPADAPAFEVQLLITLSNCAYMKRVIIPRISDSLIRAGYPEAQIKSAITQASAIYQELESRIFEAYLEQRVDPIIGMIERSMYLGQYDWGKVRHPPTEVQTYAKEILLNVAQVHAEVVAVWPRLVDSVLKRVVEDVYEEMARLMSCVSSWSNCGALQAHIDLASLNLALNNYISESAQSSLQEAIDVLPKLNKEEKRIKENVMMTFHTRMRFLLACFLDIEPIPQSTSTYSIT